MECYKIEWRKSTKKDLRKISSIDILRIISAVEVLSKNPYPQGVRKLSGSESTYRIRIGNYRVIYEVFEHTIVIEIQRVRHRKDVYQ
ncbi:MAG: type II toxin-antitoxin system mRNA interferase toxin, RelE/StbE family [Kiritimatiellae bacterium]|nr:type II toxin-antitoxin system mRNA interferase toxin, RelE/StbE family [Kiritimatiellia bacterium]